MNVNEGQMTKVRWRRESWGIAETTAEEKERQEAMR